MLLKSFCQLLTACLFAVLIASNVNAASTGEKKAPEPTSSFSVTPTVGGYFFAAQEHLDPALLYGVRVSYDFLGSNIVNSLGLEGTFNYFTTKSQGSKADGYIFRGDARYLITPRDKVVPFLAAGLGDIVLHSASSNTNSLLFNYGAGVQYFYEEWLAFRADARQLFVYRDVNTRNNFELSFGVTYLFGKEHKKKVVPVKMPAVPIPAIPDVGDQEPGAPPEVKSLAFYEKIGVTGPAMGVSTAPPVYPAPALPPVPVPTPLAFLKATAPAPAARPPAPVTPQATAAPAMERPAAQAPAPQQEPPQRVAPQPEENLQMEISFVEIPEAPQAPGQPPGHHLRKMLRRFTVEFDFGSYQIRPVYHRQIALLAAAIKASPESTVMIEGHTDYIGKKAANAVLSLNRAQSLREELVKQGVESKMITLKGYDYSHPVADNKTEKGRQRNRRAVAVVTIVTIVPDAPPAQK